MTSVELIPADVLKRKAVVYVRQSTQSQVMSNLEGKRRLNMTRRLRRSTIRRHIRDVPRSGAIVAPR